MSLVVRKKWIRGDKSCCYTKIMHVQRVVSLEEIMMHIRFQNPVMNLEEYLQFSKKILIGLGDFHEGVTLP
ncbi:hypothetical protein [Paenibacillus sp. MMS18-CY102]|uniref:hypothetical protein n=1 Tax=Paenibacillus sp. MMS18-CY102 TaxID=2682849 RepID=UPI0013658D72|nr:hypothetical protein [Paenibacillus sp. MMS18-CY102]MWC31381.1 hypothetical protein [Paenibacillus sp. MMS18-CY102]